MKQQQEQNIYLYTSTIAEKDELIEELQVNNGKYEDNSSIIGKEVERLNSVLKGKL